MEYRWNDWNGRRTTVQHSTVEECGFCGAVHVEIHVEKTHTTTLHVSDLARFEPRMTVHFTTTTTIPYTIVQSLKFGVAIMFNVI